MTESTCRIHVDWANFRHNLELMKRPGRQLMPVIKADAYGHGVLRASRELTAAGIEWAAVGTLEEAFQVRNDGFRGRILALLSHADSESCVLAAAERRVILLIHNREGLETAVRAMASPAAAGSTLEIAIKVDTGMGRLGFRLEEIAGVAEAVRACPALAPVLQVSHFAVADDPGEDEYTNRQAGIFRRAAEILRQSFPDMHLSHGNTAGILCHEDLAGDVCRPGISLYGCNPMHGTSREAAGGGFLPVMSVTTPLLSVHPLHKGESLGYGRTFKADSERLVGWAAIGYADGYRRNPAPGASMCIRGTRVPVIGRVAMQMTCLDLTGLPFTPKAGDEVFVLGGPGDAVTAQDLAGWWGTIPYEVTCLLGKNRID